MVRTKQNESTRPCRSSRYAIIFALAVATSAFTAEGLYGQSRATAPYRSAHSILGNEYGLRHMTLQFSISEVTAQTQRSWVTFPKALRKALESVLSDASRQTSPLAQAISLNSDNSDQPPTHDNLQAASQVLANHLNKSSSTLRLIARQQTSSKSPSTSQNWVFELKVPTLASGTYWIIVDKSGARSTYNYGR